MMIGIALILILHGCTSSHEVTVQEFSKFVSETGYTTTSECYGWGAVARTVYTFEAIPGATWRKPDGRHYSSATDPVTQVSYYDVQAYCEWAGERLYTIREWTTKADWGNPGVTMDTGSGGRVSPAQANFRGNVWEWTKEGAVVGGSFLCSAATCAGFSRDNYIHWPGLDAGCNNIGFRTKKN